jgi:hypothetical protein
MPTETVTSLQTGTTPNPISSNAQDFSDSDDEILDNFAAGPNPNDDGLPLGLGGEHGKQSEPASSTLEADIVNGTQPGVKQLPPDDTAGEQPQVPPASEKESDEHGPEEPETPEFPPALLQMAGLSDADAAKAAGFENPEALFAAIKWRSQLLMPGVEPVETADKGLYRRPAQQPAPVKAAAPVKAEEPPASGDKPFELPAEKMDILDEDLQDVLRGMNQHYQQQVAEIRSSLLNRQAETERQSQFDEEMQFDKCIQKLGAGWQEVFGEGTGIDLHQAGQRDPTAMTNFNHRALLFDAVQAVREVNAKQGYKPMSLEQEVQWALMQRYPDKFQQTISGKSGQRPGATASRPTQRKTPTKSQNSKLLADVNAMLKKKHGHALDMGHDEEYDGDI